MFCSEILGCAYTLFSNVLCQSLVIIIKITLVLFFKLWSLDRQMDSVISQCYYMKKVTFWIESVPQLCYCLCSFCYYLKKLLQGWLGRSMDGQTKGQKDRWIDTQMDGQSAEHINRTLLPLKVILKKFTARMDGWVPELMDGHSAR